MVVPAFAMHALEKYASDQNWLPRGVAHPLQVDLDEWEAELRDYQKNGGIPFSAIWDMLESEFGIKR